MHERGASSPQGRCLQHQAPRGNFLDTMLISKQTGTSSLRHITPISAFWANVLNICALIVVPMGQKHNYP